MLRFSGRFSCIQPWSAARKTTFSLTPHWACSTFCAASLPRMVPLPLYFLATHFYTHTQFILSLVFTLVIAPSLFARGVLAEISRGCRHVYNINWGTFPIVSISCVLKYHHPQQHNHYHHHNNTTTSQHNNTTTSKNTLFLFLRTSTPLLIFLLLRNFFPSYMRYFSTPPPG